MNEYWRDRRVLVTGCTGLLGSWLTEGLLARDADVVGIVRDAVPRSRLVAEGFMDRIDVVRGSIEDYSLLERTLGEFEVRTVFHLAAQTVVGVANRNPLSTFESNVGGTWRILEACRRSPLVEAVVVASSDKAYGAAALPYDESAPLMGRHPYDVSKSCADLIAQMYAYSFRLPVCVTRFGNLFGGGDLNWNRIVPGTIRSVLRGQRPVIRSDGTLTRDYVYVEDAADAYLLVAELMTKRPELPGEAFNFSYERPMDVFSIVKAILVAMDRIDLEPIVLGRAENEIAHQYLRSDKARSSLGWSPAIGFAEGLQRTIAWYRQLIRGGGT